MVPACSFDRTLGAYVALLLERCIDAHGIRGYDELKRRLVDPEVSNWELSGRYGFSVYQVRLLRSRIDLVHHLESTPLSPVARIEARIRRARARQRTVPDRLRA